MSSHRSGSPAASLLTTTAPVAIPTRIAGSRSLQSLAEMGDLKGCPDSTLGGILRGNGISEEGTAPVAGNPVEMAAVFLDGCGGRKMDCALDLPKLLRIQVSQQQGGVHDVIKQHRYLPAFASKSRKLGTGRSDVPRLAHLGRTEL
jgi:hypothetical protein